MITPIQILRLVIPLLFLFVSILYWTLRDKIIPPVGENLLIYGLLGLAIRLVSEPIPKAMNAMLIISVSILSLVAALFYIIIFRIQENMTKERIMEVIHVINADQVRGDKKLCCTLREIGNRLVEPDFIPGSIANALSGYERRKARTYFANIINNYLPNRIGESDLLISNRKKHFTTILNNLLFVYSSAVFIFNLIVNFTLFFPNVVK